jgi:hypothetical protein
VAEIENPDELYRSLRPDDVGTAGKIKSTAFNDRLKRQPSVDQAKLRASPEESKKNPEDGIAVLVAGEVRAISVAVDAKDGAKHNIDVVPDPIERNEQEGVEENLAHALIVSTPDFINPTRFKLLKHALAELANSRERLIEPTPSSG